MFAPIFVKLLEGIVWTFQNIIIPLSRLVFYIMIICLPLALISNLAGIIGVILFFIIFYYYVIGIIFVPPTGTVNIATIQPGLTAQPGVSV
jgi:hypothetical protein